MQQPAQRRSFARLRLASITAPLVVLCACGSDEVAPSDSHFVEVARESGIDFVHDMGRSEELYQIESLVAGAIFFDADNDGDQDLYFLNGSQIGAPPDDDTSTNRFYTNDGSGQFTDATAGTGLDDPRFSSGVSGADYDNDGDIDLYVTNFQVPNALFRNDGAAHFEDVAIEAGVPGTRANDSSSGWADLDVDGWLDLYVCNYNDHDVDNHFRCAQAKRDGSGPARRYCTVERYPAVDDVLYRSQGDGTFVNANEESGIAGHVGRSFGVAFADYDNDGDTDIFVASDREPNLLFENKGDFRFDEIGHAAGVAVDRDGSARAGMGVISGDIDNDGDMDLAVTYFEREVNGFYENKGNMRFAEWESSNGTARPSYPYVGWGANLLDADLDTDLDCFLVNGHFIDNAHLFRPPIADYEQPNLYYENDGKGNFELLSETGRAGPGMDLKEVGRGSCMADYDNDGDMDLLVLNLGRRPHLLRNDSPRNGRHWLMVEVQGTVGNRDAIGTRITAHLPDVTLTREVRTAQSFVSQGDLRQHFGLGTAAVVPKLELRWPNGETTVLENVAADQVLKVVEPQ